MPDSQQPAPTGLARRQRRLSDEETAQRTLQAAIDQVAATGLTVSLEHISFEEVIRQAGVSRSAAYRRWPYKDLFFADLLRHLAQAAEPASYPSSQLANEAISTLIIEHADWLSTAEGRHQLLIEILRLGGQVDFEAARSSRHWRTYQALHATFLSLPEGELRDDIKAALTHAEDGFVGRIAAGWQQVTELIGYRLRPETAATFESVAILANACFRGMVLMAPSIPAIAGDQLDARPFGATRAEPWPMPSLALGGIAFAFLEPDPDVTWDEARIELVRERIRDGFGAREGR
jgi:AcrR family transcriptional regulator